MRPFRGKLYVLAAASDSFGITKVQFVVRGNDGNSAVVSNGLAISYVYLGAWDTRTVPDGIYSVRTIAIHLAD